MGKGPSGPESPGSSHASMIRSGPAWVIERVALVSTIGSQAGLIEIKAARARGVASKSAIIPPATARGHHQGATGVGTVAAPAFVAAFPLVDVWLEVWLLVAGPAPCEPVGVPAARVDWVALRPVWLEGFASSKESLIVLAADASVDEASVGLPAADGGAGVQAKSVIGVVASTGCPGSGL